MSPTKLLLITLRGLKVSNSRNPKPPAIPTYLMSISLWPFLLLFFLPHISIQAPTKDSSLFWPHLAVLQMDPPPMHFQPLLDPLIWDYPNCHTGCFHLAGIKTKDQGELIISFHKMIPSRSFSFSTTVLRTSLCRCGGDCPCPALLRSASSAFLNPSSENLNLSIRRWRSWPYNSFSEAQPNPISPVLLFASPHCKGSSFLPSSPYLSPVLLYFSQTSRELFSSFPMFISHFFC